MIERNAQKGQPSEIVFPGREKIKTIKYTYKASEWAYQNKEGYLQMQKEKRDFASEECNRLSKTDPVDMNQFFENIHKNKLVYIGKIILEYLTKRQQKIRTPERFPHIFIDPNGNTRLY